jgi:hypothetical protein
LLILNIGKRELGKTTLAVSISKNYDTCVTFDPRHMIDISRDVVTDSTIGNLPHLMATKNDIVVRPEFDIEDSFERMCKFCVSYIKAHPDESFCLLIDESRFVPSPEKIKAFDWIVRVSRHC